MKKYKTSYLKPVFWVILTVATIAAVVLYYKNRPFTYAHVNNFLDKADYDILANELKKHDERLNYSKETAENLVRYNLVVTDPTIIRILQKYTPVFKDLTQNPNIYLAKNFPIEYRKYVPGSFMKKHRDALIYRIPQYECVLTLSNTTDSVTDMEGTQLKAQPNSLIIVRAQGIEHEVTKVTNGERKFLKFIFTETDDRVD
jgi:hypothetical protein